MKYEEALAELERIVAHIENGQPDIDTLGQQLKRAQQLLKLCRDRLTKTDEEIAQILSGNDDAN